MKRKYAGAQAIYLAFYSMDFYRDVARNWKGLCYTYLFILIAATQLLIAMKTQMFIDSVLNLASGYASNLPTMTIKNGELTMDKPSPYTIEAPDSRFPKVVFDFSQTQTEPKPPINENVIHVGKKEVLQWSATVESDGAGGHPIKNTEARYPIPDGLPDLIFGPGDAKQLIDLLRSTLAFSFWLVATIGGFLFCAIQSLIYGAIGKGFSSLTKAALTLGELIRVSVMAMTPVLILDCLLRFALGKPPDFFGFLIAPALTLAFLYLGCKANAQENIQASTESVTSV